MIFYLFVFISPYFFANLHQRSLPFQSNAVGYKTPKEIRVSIDLGNNYYGTSIKLTSMFLLRLLLHHLVKQAVVLHCRFRHGIALKLFGVISNG